MVLGHSHISEADKFSTALLQCWAKILLGFLDGKKIMLELNGKFTQEILVCSVPTKCTDSDENESPIPYHSNGDVLPRLISRLGLKPNTEAYIKCLR